MPKTHNFDWERIERDYRAGLLSIAEIARRHGCTRSAIQQQARKHDWSRDLSKAVRIATQTKLAGASLQAIRSKAKNEQAAPNACTSRRADGRARTSDVIEAAAEEAADVALEQRQDVRETHKLEASLLARMREVLGEGFWKVDNLEKLSAATHMFESFVRAQARRVQLACRIWSLDVTALEPEADEDDPIARMTPAQVEDRLKEIRARLASAQG